jgi:biopolymer transport protein ExbB
MNNTQIAARWAAFRWITCLAAAVTVGICYLLFQPAAAQERSPAKKPAPAAARADQSPLLTPEQLEEKYQADMAAGPAQAAPQRPASAPTKSLDFIEIVRNGGVHMWAVYAILVVSVVAVAFAIERLLGLRRSKVLPTDLIGGLRLLGTHKGEFDYRQAQRLCKLYPNSSASIVARAMLAKIGRPVPEIEHALSEASEREATRLYANVRWQNLAFNVAPMLGLAGTVHGMIIAFFTTANMPLGTNKMEMLATGIYAALVCTFAGLLVAIPAGILSHFFEGRILRLFTELDDVLRPLVPLLERFEGRPRFASPGGDSAVTAGVAQEPHGRGQAAADADER